MKDRFDLENDITALYSSADDLKAVVQMMYDSDFTYDKDRTWNTLYGLAEVIEAKVGRAMDTFSQVYKLDQYAPDDVIAMREEVMRKIKSTSLYEDLMDHYEGM